MMFKCLKYTQNHHIHFDRHVFIWHTKLCIRVTKNIGANIQIVFRILKRTHKVSMNRREGLFFLYTYLIYALLQFGKVVFYLVFFYFFLCFSTLWCVSSLFFDASLMSVYINILPVVPCVIVRRNQSLYSSLLDFYSSFVYFCVHLISFIVYSVAICCCYTGCGCLFSTPLALARPMNHEYCECDIIILLLRVMSKYLLQIYGYSSFFFYT